MLTGIELPPAPSLSEEDRLALVVIRPQVVKVRYHQTEYLRAIAGLVPSVLFLSRGEHEGYSAEEMVEDYASALAGFSAAGLIDQVIGHEIANEPNHPGGPWGWSGAFRWAAQLDQALDQIGLLGMPLVTPGLTPYYNVQDWEAAIDERRRQFRWTGVHVYWQGEHVQDAVANADSQSWGTVPLNVICTEFGEAPPEDLTKLPAERERADRCRQAVEAMAQRGWYAAVQFILRAPSFPTYRYPAPTFARILAPMTVEPSAPAPTPERQPVEDTMTRPNVLEWSSIFVPLAARHGVPPALVAAIMESESRGRQYAEDGTVLRSPAGAVGLMQLMPATAAALGVDPSVPEQNIDGGIRYLADMYRRFQSWTLAVAAYNAGPGAIERQHGIPSYTETQQYVANVRRAVLDYLDLDLAEIRADDTARAAHAPDLGTWREAYANVLGVANLLRSRIENFLETNEDIATAVIERG